MAGFWVGADVLRHARRWNDRTLPGAFRCVNAAQKYPGPIDRGKPARYVANLLNVGLSTLYRALVAWSVA